MKNFLRFCLIGENSPYAIAVFLKEVSDNNYLEFRTAKLAVRLIFQGRIYDGKVDSIYHNSDSITIQILSECISKTDIKTVITKIIKSGWRRVDNHMRCEELPIERVMEKVDKMIEKRKR